MNNIIADKVAGLLLEQRLHRLPVNPQKLGYPFTVIFDTLEGYASNSTAILRDLKSHPYLQDGVAIRLPQKEDHFLVLYNPEKSKGRTSFTLAHEIGHIILGHLDKQISDDADEKFADMFSAELLMPRCLIKKLVQQYGKAWAISQNRIFGVSAYALAVRVNSLNHSFEMSEKESALLKIYSAFLPVPNQPIVTI